MTLDELVTALQALRAACPAAGVATVEPAAVDGVSYDRGTVWLMVGRDPIAAFAIRTPASLSDDAGEDDDDEDGGVVH